jgi:DNA mismatch repair protein MutS2
MMLYPKNIEQKIGFDSVRELLRQHCSSSLGTAFVDKIKFSTSFDQVAKLCRQTEEFRQILISQEPFPSAGFLDVQEQLDKARIEGTFLLEEEFQDLKLSLQTLFSARAFFEPEERQRDYPLLAELSGAIRLDKSLLHSIDAKIDDKGHLRNNASRELMQIRQALNSEQQRARRVLDQAMRNARSKGYTPEDVSLTIRGGRMVIPVLAEHKRKIKGFIHDESATGQTVYMEPAEVLEINNEIRDLEYQERREIIRILTKLTDELRPYLEPLKQAYRFLGMIDFIRAKARFALQINALLPQMQKGQVIEWYHATHPLLYLSHQAQNKPVVPLTVSLNHQQRIVLISGPNAGGKSVSLKTVALLQYMWQCGLLIPIAENSTAGMFQSIFIDIGDEQSIENDLSTYSSHLTNMKYFCNFADKRTLFFIDEFGTGTEPQFGGAIAQSMLEDLNNKRAFGIITTHYGNLKQYAEKTPGIVNAAMRFDIEELESKFELQIGKAGSSYALEIARKIGLPDKILQNARSLVGYEQVKYDRLLGQLEKEKSEYSRLNRDLSQKEEQLKTSAKEYAELKDFLENEKKKVLNAAKAEAKQLLKDANRKIETIIREIKEQHAEKELTKKKRAELESMDQKLKPEAVKEREEIQVVGGPIEIGDMVRIKGQDTVGEVTDFKGKDAEIRIGQLSSKVKTSRLEKISRTAAKKLIKEKEQPKAMTGIDLNQKRADFSHNLDLRGKRAEEALNELDNYLDQAIMFGYNEVRIVHGKGNGILRDVIRKHLMSYPQVATAVDEHVERGGAGVTVVTLR